MCVLLPSCGLETLFYLPTYIVRPHECAHTEGFCWGLARSLIAAFPQLVLLDKQCCFLLNFDICPHAPRLTLACLRAHRSGDSFASVGVDGVRLLRLVFRWHGLLYLAPCISPLHTKSPAGCLEDYIHMHTSNVSKALSNQRKPTPRLLYRHSSLTGSAVADFFAGRR